MTLCHLCYVISSSDFQTTEVNGMHHYFRVKSIQVRVQWLSGPKKQVLGSLGLLSLVQADH